MPESYTYRYPNQSSYINLPVSQQRTGFNWQGRTLRHGYIYGYKDAAVSSTPAPGSPPSGNTSSYRQINFQNYKIFQFNPPALPMSVQLMPVEDGSVQAATGNLPTPAVGNASSSLQLFFDRTEEVARATSGGEDGKGVGDEIWRDIGVQADLFDFLKVISGGATSELSTFTNDPNAPEGWRNVKAGSLNQLSGMMFDASVTGSRIMFRPFVVVFNANLAVHVLQMTSFAFTYIRFTKDLVPTTVQVDIGLQITNMGTKSYITSGGIGGPTGSASTNPSNPAANAAPPGVLNPGAQLFPGGNF
jgi:hypothetical protein